MILALVMALPSGAMAQQADPKIIVELNRIVSTDGGCRLTFLAQNDLGRDLDQMVLETVLFTSDGAVERLTLFDLGVLPMARPRVREFDMMGLACENLGQVLFNGVGTCAGDGVTLALCENALSFVSRVDNVEVIG